MWLLFMLLLFVAVANLLLLFFFFFVIQIASVCFPAFPRLFSTFILAEDNYSRLIWSSVLSAVVFIAIVLSLFLFKLVWMLPTDRSNDGEKCRCFRLVVWIGTSIVCSYILALRDSECAGKVATQQRPAGRWRHRHLMVVWIMTRQIAIHADGLCVGSRTRHGAMYLQKHHCMQQENWREAWKLKNHYWE